MTGFTIGPATDNDLSICLALMPETARAETEHLVARRAGEIVGAAAIGWEDRRDLDGFPLDVHVVPWARRQGVGTALCQAATALVHGETGGLWSEAAHMVDSPAALFLERCGFVASRRYYFFSAALADYRDRVARNADRARARRATGLRIVPLAAAPLEDVAWLITAHFASSPVTMLKDLLARAGTDRLSSVAMRDGRVAGVVIVREQDREIVVVDAWAIDPRDRRGSTSPLLLDASLAAAAAAGFTQFDFQCDDLTRDTLGVARWGAVLVAQSDRFYRAA